MRKSSLWVHSFVVRCPGKKTIFDGMEVKTEVEKPRAKSRDVSPSPSLRAAMAADSKIADAQRAHEKWVKIQSGGKDHIGGPCSECGPLDKELLSCVEHQLSIGSGSKESKNSDVGLAHYSRKGAHLIVCEATCYKKGQHIHDRAWRDAVIAQHGVCSHMFTEAMHSDAVAIMKRADNAKKLAALRELFSGGTGLSKPVDSFSESEAIHALVGLGSNKEKAVRQPDEQQGPSKKSKS